MEGTVKREQYRGGVVKIIQLYRQSIKKELLVFTAAINPITIITDILVNQPYNKTLC